jgi:hypothetical protein
MSSRSYLCFSPSYLHTYLRASRVSRKSHHGYDHAFLRRTQKLVIVVVFYRTTEYLCLRIRISILAPSSGTLTSFRLIFSPCCEWKDFRGKNDLITLHVNILNVLHHLLDCFFPNRKNVETIPLPFYPNSRSRS